MNEQMLEHTSTHAAPWYVIPADHKWFSRIAVATVLWQRMHDLNLAFPRLNVAKLKELQEVRRLLMAEPD